MSDRANFYSVSEGHKDLSPQQKFGKLDNLNPLFPENVTFTSPKTLNDFFFCVECSIELIFTAYPKDIKSKDHSKNWTNWIILGPIFSPKN